MASIYVECPSCNTEARIDEAFLGRTIACGKCASPFVAEVGGTYDVAAIEPVAAPRVRVPREPEGSGKPTIAKPRAKPPETKAVDPALDKLMERWAED